MWKRGEALQTPVSGREATGAPTPGAPAVPGAHSVHAPEIGTKHHMDKDVANIGKSVVIKGELNSSEDLTVEGSVEGKVELSEHVLTVGPHGKIKADVFAKIAIVLGDVVGNITASEKVDIRDNGSLDGNIVSPRVAIAEGAHLRGSVDMQRKSAVAPAQLAKPDVKPELQSNLQPVLLPAVAQKPGAQRFAGV